MSKRKREWLAFILNLLACAICLEILVGDILLWAGHVATWPDGILRVLWVICFIASSVLDPEPLKWLLAKCAHFLVWLHPPVPPSMQDQLLTLRQIRDDLSALVGEQRKGRQQQ